MAAEKKTKSKKVAAPAAPAPKKGLDVKVLFAKDGGRLTVTVKLLQDGVEVASDYDFVTLNG